MSGMAPRGEESLLADPREAFPGGANLPGEQLVLHHVGMPAGVTLEDSLVGHLEDMRIWFAKHAQPWTAASLCNVEEICAQEVLLEGGVELRSDVLAAGLREGEVSQVVIALVSAGAEVDQEIDRLWKADRPDEAMFLNACAIAYVEEVRDAGRKRLASLYESVGLHVLPHYCPGYEGWRLEDQGALYSLIEDPGPVQVGERSVLSPAKSTLALFALARRAPAEERGFLFWDDLTRRPEVTHGKPEYAFGRRTLETWKKKRLTLTGVAGGAIQARFRTSGSTCANMGLPLAFDYHVELRRADAGFEIVGCRCEPAPGEKNHQSTCLYLTKPAAFEEGIREQPPLVGSSLDEALHWNPDVSPAGCLCLRSSRDHKWKVALQTIHYALAAGQAPSNTQSLPSA